MPDLHWEQVSELFDPDLMGGPPGPFYPRRHRPGLAGGLGPSHREQLAVAVRDRHHGTAAADGSQRLRTGRRSRDRRAKRLVRPGVLAIFRLWSESEISFDVDLRELQGQQGADTLCAFLQAIGSRLGSRC
jgi:hypothetical protein